MSIATCVLASCTFGSQAIPEPQIGQSIRGVLSSTPLDLVHSTTHTLQTASGTYAAKSALIFLKEYEQLDVTVLADVHYTQDGDAIATITSVEEVHEELYTPVELADFTMNITLPFAWNFTQSGSQIAISAKNNKQTLFTISRSALKSVPYGLTLTSTKVPATLVTLETGKQQLYLRLPNGVYAITTVGAFSRRNEFFQEFLDSITPIGTYAATGSTVPSGTGTATITGSGSGTVCGGVAGLLCPTGFYCQVTDTATNIGRCQQ